MTILFQQSLVYVGVLAHSSEEELPTFIHSSEVEMMSCLFFYDGR